VARTNAALRQPAAACASRRPTRPLRILARRGPAADIKVTTSDLRSQVGRIQNQVKEIQEVVRMYSTTTGPRRVRRAKIEHMSAEASDANVRRRTSQAQRLTRAQLQTRHTSRRRGLPRGCSASQPASGHRSTTLAFSAAPPAHLAPSPRRSPTRG